MTSNKFKVGDLVYARSYKVDGRWIECVVEDIVLLNHRRTVYMLRTKYIGFLSLIERYGIDIKRGMEV